MRRGLALFSLAALGACEEPPKELFSAVCNDGTHIAGAREVAESRCSRRGGLRSLASFNETREQPEAKP